jgi:hypothetical protein
MAKIESTLAAIHCGVALGSPVFRRLSTAAWPRLAAMGSVLGYGIGLGYVSIYQGSVGARRCNDGSLGEYQRQLYRMRHLGHRSRKSSRLLSASVRCAFGASLLGIGGVAGAVLWPLLLARLSEYVTDAVTKHL